MHLFEEVKYCNDTFYGELHETEMSPHALVPIIVLTFFMVSSLDEVQCFSPQVNQVECSYEDYGDACNHMCTDYDNEDENDVDDTCSHKESIDPAEALQC